MHIIIKQIKTKTGQNVTRYYNAIVDKYDRTFVPSLHGYQTIELAVAAAPCGSTIVTEIGFNYSQVKPFKNTLSKLYPAAKQLVAVHRADQHKLGWTIYGRKDTA